MPCKLKVFLRRSAVEYLDHESLANIFNYTATEVYLLTSIVPTVSPKAMDATNDCLLPACLDDRHQSC